MNEVALSSVLFRGFFVLFLKRHRVGRLRINSHWLRVGRVMCVWVGVVGVWVDVSLSRPFSPRLRENPPQAPRSAPR